MKHIVILTFILLLTFFSSFTRGDGVLIDHTCSDLDQIPDLWINAAKDNVRMYYAHTSHGEQLNVGLLNIEGSDSFYSVAINSELEGPPDEPGTVCIWNHVREPDSFFMYVENALNNNPDINMCMFQWCSELNTYTEAETQAFLDSMAALEALYPAVTFIYLTGNAQAEGSEGYNRYLRNNQIRNYCLQNSKNLFDFADLDSWYNGGQHTYIYNSIEIPAEHPQYEGDEYGHTTLESCVIKGEAVWWMLARLMGWQRMLSYGSLTPDSGYYGTRFVYEINYYDADGDAPAVIQVNIDGTDFNMTLQSGTPDNGTYHYRTRNIDVGVSHTYYFYAEDSQNGIARIPPAGTLSGPANFNPEMSLSGTPAPGSRMTIEVWGVTNALWGAAWSSEPGPWYFPLTGLSWMLGPGDLHMAKKLAAEPVHLDAFGYGSYNFKLPNNISTGAKYIQAGTKMNAYWAQTSQETFVIP